MKKISRKLAKEYFERLEEIEGKFWEEVQSLEKTMQMETGIDDIEFQWGDGWIYGIGSVDRTMKLIHRG